MRSSLCIPGSPRPAARPRRRPHLAADTVGSTFLTQKVCFALLPWHGVLEVCVSQGSWQPTLGACADTDS